MVQNEQGSWYENNQPPIGDCSLMHTAHMTLSMFQEKDAEIERLKAELLASRKLCQVWIDKSAKQDKLITVLADALERIPVVLTPPDRELVQRAKEATE